MKPRIYRGDPPFEGRRLPYCWWLLVTEGNPSAPVYVSYWFQKWESARDTLKLLYAHGKVVPYRTVT